MKKVILIVTALVMVVSGVAAVSAYEAHIINVTAHVENALDVDTTAAEFGVMFPQEWNKIKREVKLSTSAGEELGQAAGELNSVSFKIFAEWKVDTDNGTELNHLPNVMINDIDHYAWMGEWVWVAQDATQTETNPMATPSEWTNVGVAPISPAMFKPVSTTAMTLSDNSSHFVDILFLAPCFEGYYNAATDNKSAWFQAIIDAGKWPLVPDPFYGQADPENGVDMGLDLKIQVTDIVRN